MKRLYPYDWVLFPKCLALTSDGKIIPSCGMQFQQYLTKGEVKPILKKLEEMTNEHASTYLSLGAEQFSAITITEVTATHIYAKCQARSEKRALPVRARDFEWGVYTPDQFKFMLEQEYDVFGWIDAGLAVTKSQADNTEWRRVSHEISNAFNEHVNDQMRADMGLYSVPVIAETQTGMLIDTRHMDTQPLSINMDEVSEAQKAELIKAFQNQPLTIYDASCQGSAECHPAFNGPGAYTTPDGKRMFIMPAVQDFTNNQEPPLPPIEKGCPFDEPLPTIEVKPTGKDAFDGSGVSHGSIDEYVTMGYTRVVLPLVVERDEDVPMDLDRPYVPVVPFTITFNEQGCPNPDTEYLTTE